MLNFKNRLWWKNQNHSKFQSKRSTQNIQNNSIDWEFNQETQIKEEYEEGARVFHQKYGYGKIISIDGDKADVSFDKSSQKQVFLKYLQFINQFF